MPLKTFATLTAGHPLRGSITDTPDGEVAVVQMKDVDSEAGLQTEQLYRINLTGRKKPNYLRRGDILFVGRGYRVFSVLVNQDLEQTVAGPHFFILRIKPGKLILPDYLVWYINHTRAQRYFSKHVAGASLPHINRQVLEELPLIVPPLQTQELIARAHQCRLKEKAMLETLIDKKKALLNELLDKTLEQWQEV